MTTTKRQSSSNVLSHPPAPRYRVHHTNRLATPLNVWMCANSSTEFHTWAARLTFIRSPGVKCRCSYLILGASLSPGAWQSFPRSHSYIWRMWVHLINFFQTAIKKSQRNFRRYSICNLHYLLQWIPCYEGCGSTWLTFFQTAIKQSQRNFRRYSTCNLHYLLQWIPCYCIYI